MRDYFIVKFNLLGGIVSPGLLFKILKAALQAGVRKVRFGARQQLLIQVHNDDIPGFEKELKSQQISYEIGRDLHPNIISSYCGEEVFRTGQWLGSSEYHTLLDSFDYQPALKINISDSNQSFTPFFTGNINFISSPEPHYWYLYIRPKRKNTIYKWPLLIYTNHIGKVAAAVENKLIEIVESEDIFDIEHFARSIKEEMSYISLPISTELQLPAFSLPYYEGFNRYESRTWLGLYKRDEQFEIDFLLDMCALCLRSRIGEICTTPWKSLIIKGIEDQYRSEWSGLLSKHHINVRHAASELAWQTEDQNEDGTLLRKELIRYFDKNDTRTFGLCFGIQTLPKSEVFGSVLIRKRPYLKLGPISLFTAYDIFHTEHFNPNSRTYIPFELGLFKMQLAGQLERLCMRYNNRQSREKLAMAQVEVIEAPKPEVRKVAHQCPDCFTIYDEAYGDPAQGIKAGTAFQNLPADYCCPTCDTSKAEFLEIENLLATSF